MLRELKEEVDKSTIIVEESNISHATDRTRQ